MRDSSLMTRRPRKTRHLRELEAKAAAFDALRSVASDYGFDGETTRGEYDDALLTERRRRGLAPPPPPPSPPAPPFIGPREDPEKVIARFGAFLSLRPWV